MFWLLREHTKLASFSHLNWSYKITSCGPFLHNIQNAEKNTKHKITFFEKMFAISYTLHIHSFSRLHSITFYSWFTLGVILAHRPTVAIKAGAGHMLVNMDLLQMRWLVMLWLWSLVPRAHGFWLSHDTRQFYTPRHDASSCLLCLEMFSDVFEEQSPLLTVYSVLWQNLTCQFNLSC